MPTANPPERRECALQSGRREPYERQMPISVPAIPRSGCALRPGICALGGARLMSRVVVPGDRWNKRSSSCISLFRKEGAYTQ